MDELTLDNIAVARQRIAGYIRHTPLAPRLKLRNELPEKLELKLENLQVSGSFKARGVFNHLLSAAPEELTRGIVVASGGNHGLAAAYAAAKLNIPATVCLPASASSDRRERIKRWNARLFFAGDNPSDVFQFAAELAQKEGLLFIHPFDAAKTLEGTGTLGMEIAEDVPEIDCAVIAVGGGGLIAGAAYALKQLRPEIRIIGVEPAGAASLWTSLEAGTVRELAKCSTIADTLSPRAVCDRTLRMAEEFVDEIVLVSDAQIVRGMRLLWSEFNQLVEPAGAAVLAAVLEGYVDLSSAKRPLLLICGGNAAADSLFDSYSHAAFTSTAYAAGRYAVPSK
jgi:threonine dehydratase